MGIIKETIFNKKSETKDLTSVSHKKKLNTGLDYFIKAETLRNSELYNESVKFYLSSILIENDNFKCYFGLALAYKHIHEYEKAIKTLNRAKKINSHSYELHYELGVLYLLCENPIAAMKELKNAIMLDKKRVDAQIQLAKAHEVLGEEDMSLLIYKRVIEFFPSSVSAYSGLANLYMNNHKYFEAGSVYKQLLKINPNFPQAYFALGVCFEKLGKINDAIRYFRKFAEFKPNSINSAEVKRHLEKLKLKITDHSKDLKVIK